MARTRVYTPEERAEALAAVITGESTRNAARRLGIPQGTLSVWRRDMDRDPTMASVVRAAQTIPRDRDAGAREELGQLVGDYLTAGLKALRTQAEFATDRTWLEKQNAADLAIFHGVLADKLIRVLGSLRPVDDDGDEETSGT